MTNKKRGQRDLRRALREAKRGLGMDIRFDPDTIKPKPKKKGKRLRFKDDEEDC